MALWGFGCGSDTVLGYSGRDGGSPSEHARVAGADLLYLFEEQGGSTVRDRAGKSPALDLTIGDPGAVQWLDPGLRLAGETIAAQPAGEVSERVVSACVAAGEVSLEVWVTPALEVQPEPGEASPDRIAGISLDPFMQNIQIGQLQDRFRGRVWTDCGSCAERDFLVFSPAGSTALRATHLVVVFAGGNLRFYRDGAQVDSQTLEGDLSTWDGSYRVALGGEHDAGRNWQGDYHLVALYCRGLAADEVRQNFEAGY